MDYFGKPEIYLDNVKLAMGSGKGYSHVASVGSRNYLVRTNGKWHKVLRTKEILDIFGEQVCF